MTLPDGLRPERLVHGGEAVGGQGPLSPGALEDLGENQHGHVAAHAVGDLGQLEEHLGHRLPEGRVAVVELEGIGPAGEVGVPAVGQDERAATGLHLPVIVGLPFQVGVASLDVELGVLLHPGMIRGGVVGDEVHEELEPPGLADALSG